MTKRPIECSQCKKKACISYQEISAGHTTYTQMCAECPVLKANLGDTSTDNSLRSGGMCCVACHTNLDTIFDGGKLGCSNCYAIFKKHVKNFAHRLGLSPPFFKGRMPPGDYQFSATDKIRNLSAELGQALRCENYEDAASLRDEIQSLMRDVHE